MKKMIVMAALALFGTQFAKAQVQKGNFLVGGTLGVNSTTEKVDGSDNKETSTTFTISPKAGYALSDKWMVGVFVGSSFGTNKDKVGEVTTKSKHTMIAPGIFVRNYCQIADSKVFFMSEANVSYGFGNDKAGDVKTYKYSTISANVVPGISYLVGKRLMLEGQFGGLGYRNETKTTEATDAKLKTSEFAFNFTKEFTVGVAFLF